MSLRSEILCRSGCGFFGNPEWQWYCSKCWREHQLGKQGLIAKSSPRHYPTSSEYQMKTELPSSKSPISDPSETNVASDPNLREAGRSKSILSFGHMGGKSSSSNETPKNDKSRSPKRSPIRMPSQLKPSSSNKGEDKKKRFDQNLKQMFQKGRAGFSSKDSPEKKQKTEIQKKTVVSKSRPSPSRSWSADFPPEAKVISSEFASFLNSHLERPGITEISRYVKGTTEKIIQMTTEMSYLHSANQEQIEQLSTMVQEFYQKLERRLNSKPELYHALTEDDVLKIMDFAEKYVMICCYRHLFCPTMTTDEDKDLELQSRIRNLNWLSTKDLNCCINESSQDVRDLLYEAINDILEIDGKLAPQDKMECLTRCSKKIFDMLKISNETPASADDFLPCLIYICLKANPPRIQSNINFITRFCNENKLRMGEAGYFFANLCCAMSFIENMTADSLNIDPKEFDSYITGKSVPPGSWRTSLLMCDGLQVTSQNLKTLAELRKRQESVISKASKLQDEMNAFQKDVEEEVKSVLDRTKYTIRQPKKPIRPDADFDETDASALPPPLIPQTLQSATTPMSLDITNQTDVQEATGDNIKLDEQLLGASSALVPPNIISVPQTEQAQLSAFLEDYDNDFMSLSSLCTADDLSLLSVDISNNPEPSINLTDCSAENMQLSKENNSEDGQIFVTKTECKLKTSSQNPYIPAYRGLNEQIHSIPSISCDNSLVIENEPPDIRSSPVLEQDTPKSLGNISPIVDNAIGSVTENMQTSSVASTKIRKTSGESSAGELSSIATSTPSSSPLVSAATSISSGQVGEDKRTLSPQMSDDTCELNSPDSAEFKYDEKVTGDNVGNSGDA